MDGMPLGFCLKGSSDASAGLGVAEARLGLVMACLVEAQGFVDFVL